MTSPFSPCWRRLASWEVNLEYSRWVAESLGFIGPAYSDLHVRHLSFIFILYGLSLPSVSKFDSSFVRQCIPNGCLTLVDTQEFLLSEYLIILVVETLLDFLFFFNLNFSSSASVITFEGNSFPSKLLVSSEIRLGRVDGYRDFFFSHFFLLGIISGRVLIFGDSPAK